MEAATVRSREKLSSGLRAGRGMLNTSFRKYGIVFEARRSDGRVFHEKAPPCQENNL